MLYSLHLMGAELLSCKELELEKEESKKLAEAINEVNKYYGVKFDPKKVAVFNLVVTAGGIYGPMVYAIKKRLDAERLAGGGPVAVPAKGQPAPTKPMPQTAKPNIPFDPSTVSPSQVFGDQSGAI